MKNRGLGGTKYSISDMTDHGCGMRSFRFPRGVLAIIINSPLFTLYPLYDSSELSGGMGGRVHSRSVMFRNFQNVKEFWNVAHFRCWIYVLILLLGCEY